jgi:hypothetical protein
MTRPLLLLWNLPNTLIGLVLAFGGGCRVIGVCLGDDGAILNFGAPRSGPWRWWANRGFAAITMGQVIVWGNGVMSGLIRHEARHAWQAQRLGILFFPAYLIGWVVAGCRYSENWFERDARAHE